MAYAEDKPKATNIWDRTLTAVIHSDYDQPSGAPDIDDMPCMSPDPPNQTWQAMSGTYPYQAEIELELDIPTGKYTLTIQFFAHGTPTANVSCGPFDPRHADPLDTGLIIFHEPSTSRTASVQIYQ